MTKIPMTNWSFEHWDFIGHSDLVIGHSSSLVTALKFPEILSWATPSSSDNTSHTPTVMDDQGPVYSAKEIAVKKTFAMGLMLAAIAAGCSSTSKKTPTASVTEPLAPEPVAYQPAPQPYTPSPVSAQPVTYDSTQTPVASASPALGAAGSGGSYTVKRGDTLYSIARSRYGSGKRIHQNHRRQSGPDAADTQGWTDNQHSVRSRTERMGDEGRSKGRPFFARPTRDGDIQCVKFAGTQLRPNDQ